MVVPAGTTVPPPAYLVVVVAALATVGVLIYRSDPRITDVTILALAPWMVVGATAYVAYQLSLVPDVLAPFASSPTVYGATAVVAGTVWLIADTLTAARPRVLAGVGVLAALPTTIGTVVTADTLTPLVPAIAVVTTLLLTIAYMAIADRYLRPLATTGYAGTLVVFGQTLDALTTTLGVAHLGFGERTPLSRVLIEAAAGLDVPLLGSGWLFLVVKLGLAVGVVWLLAPTVEDRPREGNLLLGLVAAVGLGPGAHNLLLFTVTTP